jgi:hypothetical protein
MYVTGVRNSVYHVQTFPILAGAFFPQIPEKALVKLTSVEKLIGFD